MEEKFIPRTFATHSGSFHADEVTACALLLLFNLIDRDKIIRSRDSQKYVNVEFVCDVGGVYNPNIKRFDHHQSNYHGNLSSAGMVLQYLKDAAIINEKMYDFFNRSLILGVDAIDNGKSTPMVGFCTFSAVVANFVPAEYDVEENKLDASFFEALDFVFGHLKRLSEKFHYIETCHDKIKEEMDKKNKVLIFDSPMPWIETFFELDGENHPGLFIVMPAHNQWKLRGIPPSYEKKMQVRVPMPKDWAGLSNEELKEKSGIGGAVFCHKGRFISIWETKEDALKASELILKKMEEM